MRTARRLALVAAGLFLVAGAGTGVKADDVSSADKLLCTAIQATVCYEDGECLVGPPWSWDIPQFIEVHLDEKKLQTTQASGQNRETPIKNLERSEGTIVVQGVENGRAFSFVVNETTGFASIAVARDDRTVSVFGACTPLPE